MPFSWAYEPAYNSTYGPLPNLMREIADVQINWHWAAPLLQMLTWRHPETVKVLQEGANDDQFEFLGSAYAQNVMFASSNWANKQHVKWNREVIETILGISPTGFWNPERVWVDEFVSLLSEMGYEYTLIETDILKRGANNIDVERLWTRPVNLGEKKFYFFPDNQIFLNKMDEAIWTGKTTDLIDYLNLKLESGKNPLLCYAQDAEAMGFWQISRGLSPQKIQQNLKSLIEGFIDNEWIEIKLLSEIINKYPAVELPSLPPGQASWMKSSVQMDGYEDWFDYARNAPEIDYYRQLYLTFEDKYQSLPTTISDSNLAKEALAIHLSYQFEFGCAPGSLGEDSTRYLMNVPGRMLWEGGRQANFLIDLIKSKGSISTPRWSSYFGHPVIIWLTSRWGTIWSPIGGRCVFLVDFLKDTTISPNPFYNTGKIGLSMASYPAPEIELKQPEMTIKYQGTLFEDNCWIDGQPLGDWGTNVVIPEHAVSETKLGVTLSHTLMNAQAIPHKPEIRFWYKSVDVVFRKTLRERDGDIIMVYDVMNNGSSEKEITLEINFEGSPNPLLVLNHGQSNLESEFSLKGSPCISRIKNSISKSGMTIKSDSVPVSIEQVTGVMFAHRHKWFFRGVIKPEKSYKLIQSIKLI
jgi:hypothetical protein